MTALHQFNTRLPKATLDSFGEVIRKLRHSKQDVADAALRTFTKLPTDEQVAAIIGEPPTIETAKSLLGRTGPAPANRRKGGAR